MIFYFFIFMISIFNFSFSQATKILEYQFEEEPFLTDFKGASLPKNTWKQKRLIRRRGVESDQSKSEFGDEKVGLMRFDVQHPKNMLSDDIQPLMSVSVTLLPSLKVFKKHDETVTESNTDMNSPVVKNVTQTIKNSQNIKPVTSTNYLKVTTENILKSEPKKYSKNGVQVSLTKPPTPFETINVTKTFQKVVTSTRTFVSTNIKTSTLTSTNFDVETFLDEKTSIVKITAMNTKVVTVSPTTTEVVTIVQTPSVTPGIFTKRIKVTVTSSLPPEHINVDNWTPPTCRGKCQRFDGRILFQTHVGYLSLNNSETPLFEIVNENSGPRKLKCYWSAPPETWLRLQRVHTGSQGISIPDAAIQIPPDYGDGNINIYPVSKCVGTGKYIWRWDAMQSTKNFIPGKWTAWCFRVENSEKCDLKK